ncbi:MAG: flavodoxin family protein [Anaerotardibacter sp.]
MKHILLVGSPRINGNSAKVITLIEKHFLLECPDDEIIRYDLADLNVTGCNGCDYCRINPCCVIDDDANDVIDEIINADQVYLACPVYFSGVPSQLKALLDRFQPLFWERLELKKSGEELPPKKPLKVYLLGDSMADDPHGYEPALATIRSAFALANYEIDEVRPYIGLNKELTFETVTL